MYETTVITKDIVRRRPVNNWEPGILIRSYDGMEIVVDEKIKIKLIKSTNGRPRIHIVAPKEIPIRHHKVT